MSTEEGKPRLATVINFEGIDASGKATQAKELSKVLCEKGKTVWVFSFPRYKITVGGKLIHVAVKGENARSYGFSKVKARAAAYLHFADYEESLEEILEKMHTCDFVLFDRYVSSTVMHHGGKLPIEEWDAFADFVYKHTYNDMGLPKPDVIMYLEAPLALSLERARLRAHTERKPLDAVEEDVNYITNSYKAGQYYSRKNGWEIISCVQGQRPLLEQEILAEVIKRLQYKKII